MIVSDNSLVLRRSGNPIECSLEFRTCNLAGTGYQHIAMLSMEHAQALVTEDEKIEWLCNYEDLPERASYIHGNILVYLNRKAETDENLWGLYIRRAMKSEHICDIDEKAVECLWKVLGPDIFMNYRNDLRDHGYMQRHFEINRLRAEADRLEQGLAMDMFEDQPQEVFPWSAADSAMVRTSGHEVETDEGFSP